MPAIIIHVDMDAFYAAVEVRDNPELAGKPLIIGVLPHERGVVSTCSYEARKYGVRSAMSIKEAHRLCPHGIYMYPNMDKYVNASNKVHEIFGRYTDKVEYISLDEGFLDVTHSAHLFGEPSKIGREIKTMVMERTGLTCSVGIGYSMMSAKLASEEMKPNGFFEIPDPESLKRLIVDRSVRIIYGVGEKTAAALHKVGINTVRDIYENRDTVISLLGNHGREIIRLADGIDERKVTPYSDPKSIGKEHTFQKDIKDFNYLKDILLLISKELSFDIHMKKLYCHTVTLKATYSNMRQITRSISGNATNRADEIFKNAVSMLNKIEKRPVRLIGISLSGLTDSLSRQMSFVEANEWQKNDSIDSIVFELQRKYGRNIIKTGSEIKAEKRLSENDY